MVIICITGMSIQGYGQKGPINIIRYLDDFSYLLESDILELTELEKLKYIYPFKNKNINISFGGELREQYQYYKNPNFGDLKPGTIPDVNGYMLHRAMGLRWWKISDKQLNFSLETMYQFGSFEGLTISAFNFSSEIHYKILLGKKAISPCLGINFITGDRSPIDGKLNTYNLLYSKPSFGLAAPIGPSNIINFQPMLEFNPQPNIRIIISDFILTLQSSNDGLYTPGGTQLRPTPPLLFSTTEKFIGHQIALEIWYLHNTNWGFFIDTAYFIPGQFIKDTGNGLLIFYASVKASFKF